MRIFLLSLILCISTWSWAQTPSAFSDKPEEFVEEITDYLKSVKREETKETAERFGHHYGSGNVPSEWLTSIIKNTQLMLGERFKAWPHFELYFRIINNAITQEYPTNKFNSWNRVIHDMLVSADVSRRDVEAFLDFSLGFLGERALHISKSRTWFVDNTNYEFRFSNKVPSIYFPALELMGQTQGDSVKIVETQGSYYPLSHQWNGSKGKVTWAGTELDPRSTYVTFDAYQLSLESSDFTIDSVKLFFTTMFSEPLLGQLIVKLSINETGQSEKYPQFISYNKRIELPDFMEGVRFVGGFKLAGSNIQGSGNTEFPAILYFYGGGDSILAKALSPTYIISPKSAYSNRADLTIYYKEDSIVHPGVNMRYVTKDRLLVANQGETGIGQAPFTDTYHDLEMHFDRLVWDMDEPNMYFTMSVAGTKSPAYFYSLNFYDEETFEQYRGVTSYNPLSEIRQVTAIMGTNVVPADRIAKKIHRDLSVQQIEGLLYRLVKDGFVRYDAETQMVTVLDKVDRYVLANAEAMDHDVIRMESSTDTINAIFNQKTSELRINGVYSVTLNHRHFVHLFPKGEKLKVTENRDMSWDGTLFGGMLDFFGRDFFFNYDRYDVQVVDTDSMVFNIPTGEEDEYGAPVVEPLKTVFSGVTGVLEIDQPYNKAGFQELIGYPRFVSESPAYVYYDTKTQHGDKYGRDSFNFEIEPFEIDSLNEFNFFTQEFKGAFNSAGIFPKLEETLSLREDKSLGFVATTPPEGFDLYKGLGRYYETIDLSNRGLRGNGKIEYLGGELRSNDFLFMPDSMYALNADFSMDRGKRDSVSYPTVNADSVQVFWEPYNDSMVIQAVTKPIDMFDGHSTMKGELELNQMGLKGRGRLEWADAIVTGEDINFSGFGFRSDTIRLQIKSIDEDKVAFDLPDVKAYVDFDKNLGHFLSNDDSIPTELPFNLYQTTMDEFTWDMGNKEIEFKSHEGKEYSVFQSVHSGQDSLNFLAEHATYDLNNYELTAHGVPYINVADSRVVPGDGDVTVGEGAKMKTLEGATVLMDSSRQQFKIRDASVNILGRLDMKGTGYLDYVNRSGEKQPIQITEMGVYNRSREDTVYSFANGFVPDSQNFKLDPQIFFKGRTSIHSKEDFIKFKGVSMLNIKDTGTVRTSWFKIEDHVDPNDVQITASKAVTERNDSCYSGIFKQTDSTNLYSLLMGRKKLYIDNSIFKAYGKLKYDQATQEYIVADTGRLNGTTNQGNLFRYNDATGNIYANGKTNLDIDLGIANLEAIGTIEKKKLDSLYRLDMMLALDFYIPEDVTNVMQDDFVNITFSNDDMDVTDPTFKQALAQLLGSDEELDKMYEEYNKTGVLDLPKGFDAPKFILTDVSMVWDEYTSTFLGVGEVGLAWFNGKFIGKVMKCFVEFGYRRSEDYVNIYFESRREELWTFLNYKNKKLSAISSNVNLNTHITNVKINDRRYKTDEGIQTFGLATDFTKQKFVQQMEYFREYLKGEE